MNATTRRNTYASREFGRAFFFCGLHDVLTGNVQFIDNLLHYLLSADPPATADPEPAAADCST